MAVWSLFDSMLRPFRRKRTIPIIQEYILRNYKKEEVTQETKKNPGSSQFRNSVSSLELSWLDRIRYPELIPRYRKERRLEDLLAESSETFSQMLMRLIAQKGLKDSDVYNRANISRQLFSKIRNDKEYQPTKKTVFALAIAMRLNIDEAYDLLARAGYTFSPSKNEDLIVQYFIEEQQYDIFLINDVLEHFGQQPLI